MPSRQTLVVLFLCLVALTLIPTVVAFGAGNIPSYSYLEGKAFRHGDIEDALQNMAKAAGGGMFGRSVKFTNLDRSRVYFVSLGFCSDPFKVVSQLGDSDGADVYRVTGCETM